ncbi:uncharacterized protein V1518DRAFT_414860 [Limtongia smithiae]|uniref:uncharacterized protein n=1 Tax=Limtongia smithiae TaxID=1125753 RepID=UPI0034CDB500
MDPPAVHVSTSAIRATDKSPKQRKKSAKPEETKLSRLLSAAGQSLETALNEELKAKRKFQHPGKRDDYWNLHAGPEMDKIAQGFVDSADEEDREYYKVNRPQSRRPYWRVRRKIARCLLEDYAIATEFLRQQKYPDAEVRPGEKVPRMIYDARWAPIRAYIPQATGESPIVELPMEVLKMILNYCLESHSLNETQKRGGKKLAIVCHRFNDFIQPTLFSVLTIRSLGHLVELRDFITQSPILATYLSKALVLSMPCMTQSDADKIASLIAEILRRCQNLRTVVANFKSLYTEIKVPDLGKQMLGITGEIATSEKTMKEVTEEVNEANDIVGSNNVQSSVTTLQLMYRRYSSSPLIFARGFANLHTLRFHDIEFFGLHVTEQDLHMRLPTVEVLSLSSVVLTAEATKLLSLALPNVRDVRQTKVQPGLVLLIALFELTDTVESITMSNMSSSESLKLPKNMWTSLKSVTISNCGRINAEMFPTSDEYSLYSLPKLRELKVSGILDPVITREKLRELFRVTELLPQVLQQPDDIPLDSYNAKDHRDLDSRIKKRVPQTGTIIEVCAERGRTVGWHFSMDREWPPVTYGFVTSITTDDDHVTYEYMKPALRQRLESRVDLDEQSDAIYLLSAPHDSDSENSEHNLDEDGEHHHMAEELEWADLM